MYENLDKMKHMYKEGYRCIYKEKEGTPTWHLKNFKQEKICSITSHNDMEIGQIEDFLGELDQYQKKHGHDCICTEWSLD